MESTRPGTRNSPISVPRMIAELGEQIKNDDWAVVSGHQFTGDIFLYARPRSYIFRKNHWSHL